MERLVEEFPTKPGKPERNSCISIQSIFNITVGVVLIAILVSITIKFQQHETKFQEIQANSKEDKPAQAYIKNNEPETQLKGEQGVQGKPGQPGQKGERGLIGPKGPSGVLGQKGDRGQIGDRGVKGSTGIKGRSGDLGAPGFPGMKGDMGIVGIKGNKGDIGSPGVNGTLDNITILQSCDALKKAGFTFNGVYQIDPDGPGTGLDPFSVACDMTSDLGIGYTTIHHDREEDGHVNNHEAVALFRVNVTYDLQSAQISAVKDVSTSCRQFIKYACFGSLFHGLSSGDTYSYWMSVDGEKMINWGGVPTGVKACACWLTRSCDDTTKVCNCDVNDSVPRVDEGYLTDKSTLPVSELRFGDTGSKSERGIYTLGPLQCV